MTPEQFDLLLKELRANRRQLQICAATLVDQFGDRGLRAVVERQREDLVGLEAEAMLRHLEEDK